MSRSKRKAPVPAPASEEVKDDAGVGFGAQTLWVKRQADFHAETLPLCREGWVLVAVVAEDRSEGKGWTTFWRRGKS